MTAVQRAPELTRSIEDYLKAIYELQGSTGAAQTSAIADALAVAPPSVSGMVKRLSESGLLDHVPYRGVQLTAAGRRAALRMVRRHRILETYLTQKLGYDWDSVHEEAERLEHAVSDELIERMAMALGNPRYDPHGAPIPTMSGEIERPESVPLAEVPVGEMAELRMVSDKDAERLRYLASLGLRPGVSFEVVSRQPFRGPVTIRVTGGAGPRDQAIGYELAQALLCAVLPKEVG
jgi:DtxR family Mn-dependent transcriptional regulator